MSASETLWEMLLRIVYNRGYIYVREFVDGKWQNIPLGELPEDVAAHYVRRWVEARER